MHIGGGELYLDELLRRMQETFDVELLVITPRRRRARRAGACARHPGPRDGPYSTHPHHYEGGLRELQHLLTTWGAEAVIANTAGVFPPVDAALGLGLP